MTQQNTIDIDSMTQSVVKKKLAEAHSVYNQSFFVT